MIAIADLRAGLTAVNAEAVAVCAGLSAQQLAQRPDAQRWSIAENLAHLRITSQIFLPAVDLALAETERKNLRHEGPFALGAYGRLLVWYVEPPPAIRLPAPKRLRPPLAETPAQELERFLTSQAAMGERMKMAEGLDLTAVRFPSPLAAYVRMNLLEFFSVFNGHSRRHTWQARQVRACLADKKMSSGTSANRK